MSFFLLIFVSVKKTIKNNKIMANIFDKEVEIKTLKVNDKIIRYNKETYPHFNYTCFVINCPKYLHTALRSRYGSLYGVDVSNDNHLKIENENGKKTKKTE